jgi:thioredoxin 1
LPTDTFDVTDANFEQEVLKSELPVLVDFWAVWCVPCRMIAPAVDAIAEAYQERLRVAKMNVDENIKTPSRYGVRGIPTLLLFKGGELKETLVGVHSRDKIMEAVSRHL